MPHTAPQIPAVPVVVAFVVVTLAALVGRLHRRGALTGPRLVLAAVASGYGAGVLDAVLLPFPIHVGADANQAAWWVYVQVVPLLTADPTGIALNIALFVPLGILVPLMTSVRSARRVVLVGFLVSASIELVQLLADVAVGIGRVADVDDLIANTVGTLVGYVLLRAATTLPPVRRLAVAAA